MPTFLTLRVDKILEVREGLQRMQLEDESKAYALTAVIGFIEVGDHVLVNTTAVELGLGTGGWHVVHSIQSRTERQALNGGRVLKARYLSEQLEVDPHISDRTDLVGARILLCVLHSHFGAVSVALKSPNLGYLMTDQAGLPLRLSDVVANLERRDLLKCTATAGQAFGGDLEAVSIASAAASLLDHGCSQIILAAGPGHVGTASILGFSGMELAGHASVLVALGAQVGLCVRASSADGRQRHQGISHHNRTILRAIPVSIEVPIPIGDDTSWISENGHRPFPIEPADISTAIADSDMTILTMGRPIEEDPMACAHVGAAAAWMRTPRNEH
ncbi:MAG TPA: DUF3866 family protein [Acidimicrobiia bacterium]|nr:DUF3866 family protein [Acidimicrobiia bacterium]HIL05104.1 DUF3866 family protein [Acidimicrobiia bacterium]